jgi:hypothetical protein
MLSPAAGDNALSPKRLELGRVLAHARATCLLAGRVRGRAPPRWILQESATSQIRILSHEVEHRGCAHRMPAHRWPLEAQGGDETGQVGGARGCGVVGFRRVRKTMAARIGHDHVVVRL